MNAQPSVRFEIPRVPPSINDQRRKHWRVFAQHTKDWKWIVRDAWQRSGRPQFFRPVVVSFEFDLPRGGDADNRVKLILDGLVGTFLKDDGPDFITEIRVRSRRAKPARSVVEIADAPPGGDA